MEFTKIYELFGKTFSGLYTKAEVLKDRLEFQSSTVFTEENSCIVIQKNTVQLLMVEESERGRGIGKRLLSKAEEFIKSNGGDKVTIGMGAPYCFAGIPILENVNAVSFFEKAGYSITGEFVDMILPLSDFDAEKCSLKEVQNVEFRLAKKADRDELLGAVEKVDDEWVQYFSEDTDVFCAFHEGKLCGFEMLTYDDMTFSSAEGMKTGGVGCVGVIPEARSLGIGLSMVAYGTMMLKKAGCDENFIGTTHLEKWYSKLGAKTLVRYKRAEKNLLK